jgi:hypothetical protein
MRLAYAFLVISVSLAAFGQTDLSKQTLAAQPPFTSLIGRSATNPADENAHSHFVVSGEPITLPIRKTNTNGTTPCLGGAL